MNKVSNHFRHVATYINSDDVRTTTYKYAELVERLVVATKQLVDHPVTESCEGADSPLRTFQATDVIAVEAALAAIQGSEVGNE